MGISLDKLKIQLVVVGFERNDYTIYDVQEWLREHQQIFISASPHINKIGGEPFKLTWEPELIYWQGECLYYESTTTKNNYNFKDALAHAALEGIKKLKQLT